MTPGSRFARVCGGHLGFGCHQDFSIQALRGRIGLHAQLVREQFTGGSVVRERRGAVAGAFVQTHDLAMEAFLQRVDRQRTPRVRQGGGPVRVGGVRIGGALQHIEHALLPGGALELEPLVPVGAVAQVEAFQERAAPQVDGLVQVVTRARRLRVSWSKAAMSVQTWRPGPCARRASRPSARSAPAGRLRRSRDSAVLRLLRPSCSSLSSHSSEISRVRVTG